MSIPWDTILRSARAAAVFLPPPANVVADLALAIAAGIVGSGCNIDGCPAHVRAKLLPADVPTGERGLAALTALEARAHGLDARGIAERKAWGAKLLALAELESGGVHDAVERLLDQAERDAQEVYGE